MLPIEVTELHRVLPLHGYATAIAWVRVRLGITPPKLQHSPNNCWQAAQKTRHVMSCHVMFASPKRHMLSIVHHSNTSAPQRQAARNGAPT